MDSDLHIEIEKLKKANEDLRQTNVMLLEELNGLKIQLKSQENKFTDLQKARLHETPDSNVQTKRFEMVTVLFSNIRGIGNISADENNAQNIVDEMDQLFFKFDNIVEKLNIEKIKSIGDSYMCAGGMPTKNRTNPIEIVMAALEIQAYMKDQNALREDNGLWDLSIGIHTGPVTATISGKKKISYELKGDAANIASRIEAYSKAGKVIISEMTYEFVRNFFTCEKAGSLPVKYTGAISMYEVLGFNPQYSFDDQLVIPNDKFRVVFGHIRFDDLEDVILTKLENELPRHLHYHNVKHTMDVVIGVEVIGTAEGISEEEMLYLKTAGLFHDMGQIVQSKGHEEISCKYAKEILPAYSYTHDQIEFICEIIMATQLPPNPKTLLQRIICDADLDYLGRSDFIPVSDTLFEELSVQNIITDKNQWNQLQIKFISGHQYFTDFAKNNREVNKQKQIERLKGLID